MSSFIDLWTGPSSFQLDLWVVKSLKVGETRLKSNGERVRERETDEEEEKTG